MLSFGWSRFVLRFPTLPLPFPGVWGPFQARQLQLVPSQPACTTASLVLWQGPCICLSFFLFWFSLTFKTANFIVHVFFLFGKYHYIWSSGQDYGDLFISLNPREFCLFHFPWENLLLLLLLLSLLLLLLLLLFNDFVWLYPASVAFIWLIYYKQVFNVSSLFSYFQF